MRALVSCVACGLVCALPSVASAYRTLQDDPELGTAEPVVWSDSPVVMELSTGALQDAQRDVIERELRAALASWNGLECSTLVYSFSGGRGATEASPGDGRNTVQWVTVRWSSSFDADAAATTDVQLERDGTEPGAPWRIVEADIYVNADTFEWRPLSADPDAAHLAGALTHELGHVHGLMHPCEPDGAGGVTNCSSSPIYMESALFPIHSAGARAPAADDIAGTCALYPRWACEGCAQDQVCIEGACRSASEHTDCPECTACLEPAECAAGETCRYGGCEPQALLGQACSHDVDCDTSSCEAGRCTRSCHQDDNPCPASFACQGSPPLCVSMVGADRATCAAGAECRTGLCLERMDGDIGHCTNECSAEEDCLHGEACRAIEGSHVCVPIPDTGGCSAASGATASANLLPLLPLLLLVARSRRLVPSHRRIR